VLERPAPEKPPRRRLGGFVVWVAAIIAGVTVVVIGLHRQDDLAVPTSPPPGFEVPELDVAPGTAVPTVTGVVSGGDASTISAWAERLSKKTEIPGRSLEAYARAELTTRAADPDCGINWATLAGVGRVESHHGRYNGTHISENGVLTPPIIGIPLDGSPGVKAVPDTDNGALDGDSRWDRAVGAMQFLPSTWALWGTRANGDNATPDPQNIDDAALSAARYLCSVGGDLTSAQGWWQAVLTYNKSVTYGKDVFNGADAYARAAATL
jgi:membrane-bound lytic murein transglycosylase B